MIEIAFVFIVMFYSYIRLNDFDKRRFERSKAIKRYLKGRLTNKVRHEK